MTALQDDLLHAYRTASHKSQYNVLIDWMLRRAGQGYRIVHINSCMKDTGLIREVIEMFCCVNGIELEPYWKDMGIRLVPVDEPNRN